MQDFVWLTEEIILRNFDVGFSGQVWDVVVHALTLLQCCVTLHRLSLGDVHVAPKRTEAAVVELSRHSAALLPVFIQEAVGGEFPLKYSLAPPLPAASCGPLPTPDIPQVRGLRRPITAVGLNDFLGTC